MNHLAFLKNDITGKMFDTKAKVLQLKSADNLSFHVSESFDKANWSIEPQLNLRQIYALRAAQIRKKYDYIVFYFSGGSDSITALNAFIRNNIPIDEVLIYVNSDTTDIKINNFYALQYLKNIGYKGFVNVVDLNFPVINDILKNQTWKQYECSSGLLHSFYRWRIEFYENLGYTKSVDRKQNVAHVFSGLFPTIKVVDDNVYSNISIRSVIPAPCNPDNVQFFTSNDFPQVHIKQSHVLARYIVETDVSLADYHLEDKNFKLTIRDEYKNEINSPKAKGITNLEKMTVESQHDLLFKLYSDKSELIENYNLVLEHFNSFKVIDLDQFNKNFFLFSIGKVS